MLEASERGGGVFEDRAAAGRRLADELTGRDLREPLVLGLPRGGVPVAAQVAASLGAPLDVLVVRKIGAPGHEEYALGAIGEDGVELLRQDAMTRLGLDRDDVSATIEREREELQRRLRRYRGEADGADVAGRTVVVVDDGVATGATAQAAGDVLRERGAARTILAVPVTSPRALPRLEETYDEVVALEAPDGFRGVGQFYARFDQTSDDEVVELLEQRAAAAEGGR